MSIQDRAEQAASGLRSPESRHPDLKTLDSVQLRADGWWIYFTDETREGPFKSISHAVASCKQITETQIIEAFYGKV